MSDMDTEQARRAMGSWYWWGVPTLFRCPWDENPANCDIGLVGVPHSSGNGSTERDQHLGPRAVRNISGYYRRAHTKMGIVPWDQCRINDLGDVPLPEAMVNDICVEDIEAYFRRLDFCGTRPVSIGGDHSITGPIIKAVAGPQARLSGGKKAALLHFDAHTDTYEHLPHWLGARRSAAHWAAYVAAEGHVDPSKSTQLGIRGHTTTLDWRSQSESIGYRMIKMEEFTRLGVEETVRIVRERVGDAPLYVTFDLDCLDPSVAPGVSNLEPAESGMTMTQATGVLQGLEGLNLIGGDVVCLMPTKDNPNGITAHNAMVVMFELISLMASYTRRVRR